MLKIGIMGGTFNPIHNGHIAIAQAAYEQFHLDEVWFMPNNIPAYKINQQLLSGAVRCEMISLAIQDYPYFRLSDFEVNREGKTYTYETMEKLYFQYPDVYFYFIMGADSMFYFEKWLHPEIILQYTEILVACRDENGIPQLEKQIQYLSEKYRVEKFNIVHMDKIVCSSSAIRDFFIHENTKALGEDEICDKLKLPPAVFHYIRKNHLYKMSYKEFT